MTINEWISPHTIAKSVVQHVAIASNAWVGVVLSSTALCSMQKPAGMTKHRAKGCKLS